MIVAVDFDGTIVEHEYPLVGKDIPEALQTLRWLRQRGHKIVLFTMRSGTKLQDAVEYIEGNGVSLYGVNTNPTQKNWTKSPKAYAQIYIDDAALGCPLIYPDKGRPYVDWVKVKQQLTNGNYDI